MNDKSIMLTLDLARKLIEEQFTEYASLPIVDVEKQGHDTRTYRLGDDMLIRYANSGKLRFKSSKRARAVAAISETFKC